MSSPIGCDAKIAQVLGYLRLSVSICGSTAFSRFRKLLEDYRDFMRNRAIEEWPSRHPFALRLRRLNRTPGANYDTFRKGLEHRDPAICANVIAGLIKVTCYLLDHQLRRLEQDFLREGGLRERMTRSRMTARVRQQSG
ncbi:MAG: hypothetical protein H7A46_16475 [Verrucomicrobiales bacterium]|nr:hypothetical protein [Verrucomicrobiales bacterium]